MNDKLYKRKMESSAFGILAISFAILYAPSSSGELNTNIEGVIVPGLSVDEFPDSSTVYYDKLAPIILEFKVFPGLTATANMMMGRSRILPARLQCRNEDRPFPTVSVADWYFTCPLSFHLTNTLNQLYGNWTDFHPNNRGGSSRNTFNTEFQYFSNSELSFEECESQLRYWRGISNRDTGVSELRLILEKCSAASYFEEQIGDYGSTFGSVYDQMRDNYVTNFFANGSEPNSNGGDMIATLVALQSLMTLQFYSEVSRWKEAWASCQNNLIPNSIVKANRLERALQEIKGKLTPMKLSPSVSTFSKLFKIPIADCIFGQNSFFVRILLPIKKDRTAYRPIRINQPRFLYNDEVCQLTSNSKSDGAFPLTTTGYLMERMSRSLVAAGCDSASRNRKSGQMCKIPDRTFIPPPDKCLTAVTNENLEGIKSFCRLDCEKISLPNLHSTPLVELPIIHRVESSKFLITLNTITSILVKCEAAGLPDQMIPPQKYGAVEVILPCDCFIMYHAEKYFAHEPCTSSTLSIVAIHHALPIHMVNSTYASFVSSILQPWAGKPRSSYYGRRRITFPNVTLFINMTFRDQDMMEVDLYDSNEYVEPEINVSGENESSGEGKDSGERSESGTNGEKANEEGHVFLWSVIAVQGIGIFASFAYFFVKIQSMERNGYRSRATISFQNNAHDQSQLTLSERFVTT